jgi:prolyl-tRNA synthetase
MLNTGYPSNPSFGEVSGPLDLTSLASAVAKHCNVPITIKNDDNDKFSITFKEGTITGYGAVLRSISNVNPSTGMFGVTQFEEGQVDSWVEFATLELSSHTNVLPPQVMVESAFSRLNQVLLNRTYLVGNTITLADFVIYFGLKRFSSLPDKSTLPNLMRWYETIAHLPCLNDSTSSSSSSSSSVTGGAGGGGESQDNEPLKLDPNANDLPPVAKLNEFGIESKTYIHKLSHTVEEQAEHVKGIEGVLTRNLLLRDKKHGYFFVSAWEHRNTKDTKKLAELLGLKGKTNLRLCDESILKEYLGVTKGSLSFLACMNDTENKVTLALDKALLNESYVNGHPMRCDRTTSVAPKGVLEFLSKVNHDPILLDFGPIDKKNISKPTSSSAATSSSLSAAASNDTKKNNEKQAKPAKQEKQPKPQKKKGNAGGSGRGGGGGGGGAKKETKLALQYTKDGDFAAWYPELVEKSEMLSYGDVSGCYILRPWGYAVWEHISKWFDNEIKLLDVENCYFPLFVSQAALEKEKDHVEGFAPEVAWVTRSGETDLAEPIAVRPTSETIMYPEFAKWVQSHRDLPILVNQWCNVVRWEFKYPTPFLRSREFLWQEGHTAHVTIEEANEMVYDILELYKQVYEKLLCVPVIKGVKTESEKFAGGYFTTTVEAYIPGSGRAIQGATSHNLGQNFGKMFEINYEGKDKTTQVPWQTSWGLTTRTIGVMVMTHGDDKGLIMPPAVAPKQVVIVPIPHKELDGKLLDDYAKSVEKTLRKGGIRVKLDNRDNYNPGWKYNHWELKGVPIRLEIGRNEVKNSSACLAIRFDGIKENYDGDDLVNHIKQRLDKIQTDMLNKATGIRNSKLKVVMKWNDFVPALNDKCLCLTPFCDEEEEEDRVKELSRNEVLQGEAEDVRTATSIAAKTLCKPSMPQAGLPEVPPIEGLTCFSSGKPATAWVLWGRSY